MWGVEVCLHSLLICTRWRWVVSITSSPVYTLERASCTRWIGGWVGPSVALDVLGQKTLVAVAILMRDRPARSGEQYRLSCLGCKLNFTCYNITFWYTHTHTSLGLLHFLVFYRGRSHTNCSSKNSLSAWRWLKFAETCSMSHYLKHCILTDD
jgi:hypothetical protein